MVAMPRWAVYIFWIWLFVSLVILVMRRINKRGGEGAAEPSTVAPSTPGATTRAAPTDTASPVEKVWPAPPPPDPDDDTYRLDPSEGGPAAEPSVATPVAGTPSAPLGVPGPSSTLPELLAGITLPHELVPLTQGDMSIDLATHVVVSTQKASAEAVTTSMCAELEKLGYEIERESMLKVRATGERGVVKVEVHADGAAVMDGTVRRFPTALEGSVVVELWAV